MPFDAEDLARTALVRILPRSRHRLAAPTDARFASVAANAVRIAFRQQGAQPSFVIFSGPGQDPRAAALAAAEWAAANWRPNAVQRRVAPGVVVVQVAPASALAAAGSVAGAAVPAAIWTVDAETGRTAIAGRPPGAPPGREVRKAAAALAKGLPPPALGELDLAERSLQQVRSIAMPGLVLGGVSICMVLFVLRYGLGALFGIFLYSSALTGSGYVSAAAAVAGLVGNTLLLAGILLGLGVLFNVRNLAFRMPGFSSPVGRTRSLTWTAYAVVMIALAVGLDAGMGAAVRASTARTVHAEYAHVTATVDDDGSEVVVWNGGDLRVDLSGWPPAEWPGVSMKTSNPSVLALDSAPSGGGPPAGLFSAHQVGVARVEAVSADGRYTYQLRVTVSAG